MRLRLLRYLTLAALTALLGLSGSIGSFSGGALAQGQECTVTLSPGESIQATIDRAVEGVVICLSEGTWEENFRITKSLTLRGAGQEQTSLKGKEVGKPVIRIMSSADIDVRVQDLAISNAKGGYKCSNGVCPSGIQVQGKARASLSNIQITNCGRSGLHVGDYAQVSLIDSQIFSSWTGLDLRGSAQVYVVNSQIFRNGWEGIIVFSDSIEGVQLSLSDSQIFDNLGPGLFIWGRSNRLSLSNSQVFGNSGSGLEIRSGGQVSLARSQILSNMDDGIILEGPLHSSIHNSQVRGNGGTGIWLQSAAAEIQATWITDNGGCGIAAYGQVTITGQNNWLQYNAGDHCFRPPFDFLRADPPETLFDFIEVCPQGCHFSEISPAIWRLKEGGVLKVQSGSYRGGVVLVKDLTMEGRGNPVISGSAWSGVLIKGPVNICLQGFQISGNRWYGLETENDQLLRAAQLSFSNLGLLGNYVGMVVSGPARVQLNNVHISDNKTDGLEVFSLGLTIIEVHFSQIKRNGTSYKCQRVGPEPWEICNGITVKGGKLQLKILDSVIINNTDWGMAAELKRCGYEYDFFSGIVLFSDNTVIRGNNTSGNQDGMGNPGDHPWNHPNVPDGQVCLP